MCNNTRWEGNTSLFKFNIMNEAKMYYRRLLRWTNKYIRTYEDVVIYLHSLLDYYNGVLSSNASRLGKSIANDRIVAIKALKRVYDRHYEKKKRIMELLGYYVIGEAVYLNNDLVGYLYAWKQIIRKNRSL